jgi:hypothetical protein
MSYAVAENRQAIERVGLLEDRRKRGLALLTFSPLTRLSGQSLSQDAKADHLRSAKDEDLSPPKESAW